MHLAESFKLADHGLARDKHQIRIAGGIEGAVVVTAGGIDDYEVRAAVARAIEDRDKAACLRGYHGRAFVAAPVFPVRGRRLGIEVDKRHVLPSACGGNRQSEGGGRFAAAAFGADK